MIVGYYLCPGRFAFSSCDIGVRTYATKCPPRKIEKEGRVIAMKALGKFPKRNVLSGKMLLLEHSSEHLGLWVLQSGALCCPVLKLKGL